MTEPFDLIVIGTGEGGSGPAYRCRKAGWRVAVVDELPYGGTCALRGCDPKKVLVGAAELADWHRRMQGRGVSGDAHVSWPELMQFKQTFTDPVPADREKAFQKAGIATYHGPARFVSPERLSVDGQVLEARHYVVAAGAKPRHLGISGEEYLVTSTAFLELDELPPRIAFLGAGYISFEFAHLSRRAGAQATIIGRGKPLQHFEQVPRHAARSPHAEPRHRAPARHGSDRAREARRRLPAAAGRAGPERNDRRRSGHPRRWTRAQHRGPRPQGGGYRGRARRGCASERVSPERVEPARLCGG